MLVRNHAVISRLAQRNPVVGSTVMPGLPNRELANTLNGQGQSMYGRLEQISGWRKCGPCSIARHGLNVVASPVTLFNATTGFPV